MLNMPKSASDVRQAGREAGRRVHEMSCIESVSDMRRLIDSSVRVEGKGENHQVCSVQYCVQQLYTVNCTHMNRPNSSLDWVLSHWAHFTVLRFIFI